MSGTAPRKHLTPVGDANGHPVYYHEVRGTYHTWWADGSYEPVSTVLLVTVPAVLGVEPDALEALSASVDPDALNDLFEYWRRGDTAVGDGSVSFTYAACAVTVRADGEIAIDPAERSDRSTD